MPLFNPTSAGSVPAGVRPDKVTVNEDGDQVEGYHIHVGGGYGPDARIAREIYPATRVEDVPATVTRISADAVTDERRGAVFVATLARPGSSASRATTRSTLPSTTTAGRSNAIAAIAAAV